MTSRRTRSRVVTATGIAFMTLSVLAGCGGGSSGDAASDAAVTTTGSGDAAVTTTDPGGDAGSSTIPGTTEVETGAGEKPRDEVCETAVPMLEAQPVVNSVEASAAHRATTLATLKELAQVADGDAADIFAGTLQAMEADENRLPGPELNEALVGCAETTLVLELNDDGLGAMPAEVPAGIVALEVVTNAEGAGYGFVPVEGGHDRRGGPWPDRVGQHRGAPSPGGRIRPRAWPTCSSWNRGPMRPWPWPIRRGTSPARRPFASSP